MSLYSTNINNWDSSQISLRIQGVGGTTSAPGINNIDAGFPEERLINGGTLLVRGGKLGDKIGMQVIDPLNILGYGVDAVLNQFVENMYINPDSTFQINYEVSYIARLYPWMNIRILYDATDSDTRHIWLNLITHIPTT